MPLFLARANLTTIGDDRATALKRFERFVQQFVDDGLIKGFSIDEPGDMEQDMEGPATWMSELEIQFESEHEWPTDDLDDESEAMIEKLRDELAEIRTRIAERLEAADNIAFDYFNHDELTFEGPEPAEVDPLCAAHTIMRTGVSTSVEEARYLFDKVLESWQRDGFLTAYRIDPDGGKIASDDGTRYSKIHIYFRVSSDVSDQHRLDVARELLDARADQMNARAAEHDVEFLGWSEVKLLG